MYGVCSLAPDKLNSVPRTFLNVFFLRIQAFNPRCDDFFPPHGRVKKGLKTTVD